jgi:hypothetical protein
MVLFGGTALAAIVYFLRFRVPIMAAVLALSFTGAAFFFATLYFYDGVTAGQVLMPTMEQIPEVITKALYVPLFCGFVVFGTAVAFDLHDRERFTVWSDCAFWLHVISAPLLVHPLFILATGQDVVFGEIEPGLSASVMLGCADRRLRLCGARHRPALAADPDARLFRLARHLLPRQFGRQLDRNPAFCADPARDRGADHHVRRGLAAHQALDCRIDPPHIGAEKTPSHKT